MQSKLESKILKPLKVPKKTRVLLLVDVINPMHFPNSQAFLPYALVAANRIAAFKLRLEKCSVQAIYANDNYGTWHSSFSDILAACKKLPGARGEIARLLEPKTEDLVILKPQHSAFHSTPLLHLLRKMEATKLNIVGFSTDICVMLTATDARMNGYAVRVPEDCTAAESMHRKLEALRQLHETFKCSIQPTLRSKDDR